MRIPSLLCFCPCMNIPKDVRCLTSSCTLFFNNPSMAKARPFANWICDLLEASCSCAKYFFWNLLGNRLDIVVAMLNDKDRAENTFLWAASPSVPNWQQEVNFNNSSNHLCFSTLSFILVKWMHTGQAWYTSRSNLLHQWFNLKTHGVEVLWNPNKGHAHACIVDNQICSMLWIASMVKHAGTSEL